MILCLYNQRNIVDMKFFTASLLLLTITLTSNISAQNNISISPNPMEDSAIIHFDLDKTDTITLQVFDVIGTTKKTLFNSTILPSGSYYINLKSDSLLDGLYIIRFQNGFGKNSTYNIIKKSLQAENKNPLFAAISAYPNPVSESVTISNLPPNGLKTITILDIAGKIVKTYTTNSSSKSCSLKELLSGVYFIVITNDKKEKINTLKIIKD